MQDMIVRASVATFAHTLPQARPADPSPVHFKMQVPPTLSSPRLSPEDEMLAALAPMPTPADGDPDTIFAVAAMLHTDEQQHLAAVFQSYTPALVIRARADERAMAQGLLWPENYFGAGSDQSAFGVVWARLVPALVAGGLHLAVLQQAVSSLSERARRFFSVVGRHLPTLVGLAIFSSRRFQPSAEARPPSPSSAPAPSEQAPSPAPSTESEPDLDSCASPDSSSDSGWGRWCPQTGEAGRALAPMALSEEFFLWAASRDGDTNAVAAFLRNLGGLHIDDTWLGWTSLLKASENKPL